MNKQTDNQNSYFIQHLAYLGCHVKDPSVTIMFIPNIENKEEEIIDIDHVDVSDVDFT